MLEAESRSQRSLKDQKAFHLVVIPETSESVVQLVSLWLSAQKVQTFGLSVSKVTITGRSLRSLTVLGLFLLNQLF